VTEDHYPDVLIVGAGPVGLTLANLLGMHGVRTLVMERNATLEPEPRAVTLDDESLRTMQAAGLMYQVIRDVTLDYGVQYFDWRGKPFAAIAPTRQEYGFPKRNAFRQPLLVRTLYAGLQRFAHVHVRFDHTFTACTQDAQGVRAVFDVGGHEQIVRTHWLVACDGAHSAVREYCRIVLDGQTYAERWLIVDMEQRTLPLRHTHTYCDPQRPAIRLPGPHASLRYEFMLRPSDHDEQVLNEANFRRWIADRVAADRDLPVIRKAIYGFHARVATRWREGRILLAGDAAHLTPPFAGQGLNSGIRDASNLAWKLAAVVQHDFPEEFLDSYEQERRSHAAALIRMAVRIGTVMQPKSILRAAFTQTTLRAICCIPVCRDYILQLRFKPKPRFTRGFFVQSPALRYSELVPQPKVQQGHAEVLLDEVLGTGFAVIGWDASTLREIAVQDVPPGFPTTLVALVRREDDFLPVMDRPGVVQVRDIDGVFTQLLDRLQARALVLRPDRYIYRAVPRASTRSH